MSLTTDAKRGAQKIAKSNGHRLGDWTDPFRLWPWGKQYTAECKDCGRIVIIQTNPAGNTYGISEVTPCTPKNSP